MATGRWEIRENIYGTAFGDRMMMKLFAGDNNVNGLSDPVCLSTLLKFREACRDGSGIRETMKAVFPMAWNGVMRWLNNVLTGRTTASAIRDGETAPTEA